MRTIKCIGYEGHECGKTVRATNNRQKRCPACAKEAQRKYDHSPKGRKTRRKYRRSPEGRKAQRKYMHSPKGRKAQRKVQRKYMHSPKGRKARRKASRKASRKAGRKLKPRHREMLRRAKKLKDRGIKGRPISLKRHKEKLFYSDGQPRPCTYCGHEIGETGSGLDRKDSSIGYTDSNTVACCGGCNVWKSSNRTYLETMKHFKPLRDAARKRRQENS